MIKKQVKSILDDLNYNMNTIIPMTEVNAIVLEGNMNIYPEPDSRFYFKSDGNIELILYYHGKYNDDGEFIPNEKPYYVVPFDQILSIQLISDSRISAPFRYGKSM